MTFHHASLFQGLWHLFENVLGFEVYRPFGISWWDEGYFSYSNEDFGKGILQTASRITEMNPDLIDTTVEPMGRLITLQQAKDRANEIRFMVSSLYESEPGFAKFLQDFGTSRSTLIRQCGNPNEPVRYASHVLSSDLQTYDRIKNTHHVILYHQWFPLSKFTWKPINTKRLPRRIKQYVNFIRSNQICFAAWERLTRMFPSDSEVVRFYEHGLQGKDGEFRTLSSLAKSLQDADFIVSFKWWDGYGFIVHQAYACGRPIITRVGDYEGKIADALLEEPSCAIKLRGDFEDDKKRLTSCFESDTFIWMCWNAYNRFREIVNFEEEERQIERWIAEI